jgi:hypothetical protein
MEWRFSAAKNPLTPAEILEGLFVYEDCRFWLSQNPSSPKKLMAMLGEKEAFEHLDAINWRQAVAYVLSHPNTDSKTILKILEWTNGFLNQPLKDEDPDWIPEDLETYFISSAALNENAPVELLIKFEKSSNENNIFYLLRNPNLPMDLIQKYVDIALRTTDHEILHNYSEIARNRSLTASQIEKLSKHPKFYIRDSIARNLSTPISVLLFLKDDESPQVQYGVIFNPNTPIEVLHQKASMDDSEIRNLGVENPSGFRGAVRLALSRRTVNE